MSSQMDYISEPSLEYPEISTENIDINDNSSLFSEIEQEENNTQQTDTSTIIRKKAKKPNYNALDFKLETKEISSIYIFKNGLFTRVLLLIKVGEPRQISI